MNTSLSVLRTEAMQSEINKKIVDTKTENCTFKSYVHDYYVYHKIWMQVIEECRICRKEPRNTEDKNTVTEVNDGFVLGHVPKRLNSWMSMFLRLPKSSINCKITWDKVNREAGNGL